MTGRNRASRHVFGHFRADRSVCRHIRRRSASGRCGKPAVCTRSAGDWLRTGRRREGAVRLSLGPWRPWHVRWPRHRQRRGTVGGTTPAGTDRAPCSGSARRRVFPTPRGHPLPTGGTRRGAGGSRGPPPSRALARAESGRHTIATNIAHTASAGQRRPSRMGKPTSRREQQAAACFARLALTGRRRGAARRHSGTTHRARGCRPG